MVGSRPTQRHDLRICTSSCTAVLKNAVAPVTLTTVTVVRGFRFALVRTPWQPTYHLIYAAFLGTVGESAIVDIDHWRHYFLMLGVLWGLMAVSRPYLARPPVPA